jgi:hypothetical protein
MRRRLNASVAQEIARLEGEEIQIALTELATKNHLTVTSVRKAIASTRQELDHRTGDVESDAKGIDYVSEELVAGTSFVGQTNPDFIPLQVKDGRRNLTEPEQLDSAALILRLALIRLSNLVDGLPQESNVRELLLVEKFQIHNMIDSLIKMRSKTERRTIAHLQLARVRHAKFVNNGTNPQKLAGIL